MGRPQSVKGGRPHAVSTKLSDAEVAYVDAARGSLSRAEWLRWQVIQAQRRDRARAEQQGEGAGLRPKFASRTPGEETHEV